MKKPQEILLEEMKINLIELMTQKQKDRMDEWDRLNKQAEALKAKLRLEELKDMVPQTTPPTYRETPFMNPECDSSARELASLRRDAARLDFLEKYMVGMLNSENSVDMPRLVDDNIIHGSCINPTMSFPCFIVSKGKTIREFIDNVMSYKQEEIDALFAPLGAPQATSGMPAAPDEEN